LESCAFEIVVDDEKRDGNGSSYTFFFFFLSPFHLMMTRRAREGSRSIDEFLPVLSSAFDVPAQAAIRSITS
jgi:hypothetical protein